MNSTPLVRVQCTSLVSRKWGGTRSEFSTRIWLGGLHCQSNRNLEHMAFEVVFTSSEITWVVFPHEDATEHNFSKSQNLMS